jgi:hypothetical protein
MASGVERAQYKRAHETVHEHEREREITPAEAPQEAQDADACAKRMRFGATFDESALAAGSGEDNASLDYDALALLGLVEARRDGSSLPPQLATTPLTFACDDGSEAAAGVVCVHLDIHDDGDDDNDDDGENDESDESDEENEDSDDSNCDGHESESGDGVASTRGNGADDDLTPRLEHGAT